VSGAVPVQSFLPIAEVRWRDRARVKGRVRSLRVQPWAGAPTIECVLVDDTGGLIIVFLGRRWIAGIRPGTVLIAEGMVGEHNGRPAIINPEYEIVPNGND
jgi:RecG-like helicase